MISPHSLFLHLSLALLNPKFLRVPLFLSLVPQTEEEESPRLCFRVRTPNFLPTHTLSLSLQFDLLLHRLVNAGTYWSRFRPFQQFPFLNFVIARRVLSRNPNFTFTHLPVWVRVLSFEDCLVEHFRGQF